MSRSLEVILVDLLSITLELERRILSPNAEVEEWLSILDIRETRIQELDSLIQSGAIITPDLKQKYLTEILALNQRVIPVVEKKLGELKVKIHQLQLRKKVSHQYEGPDYAPFGAFFDKKK